MTSALGRSLGPHVRRHSENLLPKSWTRRDSATGRSTVDDVTEVVASGIQGSKELHSLQSTLFFIIKIIWMFIG